MTTATKGLAPFVVVIVVPLVVTVETPPRVPLPAAPVPLILIIDVVVNVLPAELVVVITTAAAPPVAFAAPGTVVTIALPAEFVLVMTLGAPEIDPALATPRSELMAPCRAAMLLAY